MEQRRFGNTGLTVSALGYGAGHIGRPEMTEQEAEQILHTVLDLGITLIDTARGYGLSEERIGRHLAHRRQEFVLSTKVGYSVEGYEDWTGPTITAGIDRALKTLHTDYLDIVHLHSCPLEVLQQGDVVEALVRAEEAGKIRVAAYSGENEALQYAIDSGAFGSLQFSVNICDQRVIDNGLKLAYEHELGVIAKRPLANAPWRFAERPVGEYAEEYWVRLQEMGLSPGELEWDEFALRFTAFLPGVSTCIVGTSRIENLKRNAEILKKGSLPSGVVREVREAFAAKDWEWVGQI
ncbi:aldo/keto reductase [Tumebacillus permanentifrigoris]|uniref:Aryl-alcohol dehydrogenase-like predicted oxidoreductase n=1 Tax=Tumebacillus permanentifrigoris TaxID=378543 RepID=A0A316D887_9BACL|nr:aldo/keto reductase [Tumebacillus permanentifrigoris]PWK13059.1 aryl-alcohol dehydrogenase-like predicted oxidoreductase [Tumebacillus permanentifrigoris]